MAVKLERSLATVLFTDIVGSTARAAELSDHSWRVFLHRHHELVRRELRRFGAREVTTAGDSFLAVFEQPDRAIRCAVTIRDAVRELGLEIRSGLQTFHLIYRKIFPIMEVYEAFRMGKTSRYLIPYSLELVQGGRIACQGRTDRYWYDPG